jgi:hypothetical protein
MDSDVRTGVIVTSTRFAKSAKLVAVHIKFRRNEENESLWTVEGGKGGRGKN